MVDIKPMRANVTLSRRVDPMVQHLLRSIMERTMEDLRRQRHATLIYIQSMLGELRTMAEAERCDMLTYLVEMAYVEASDIVRGERPHRAQTPSAIQQHKRYGAA
jgi:hypothetical protein